MSERSFGRAVRGTSDGRRRTDSAIRPFSVAAATAAAGAAVVRGGTDRLGTEILPLLAAAAAVAAAAAAGAVVVVSEKFSAVLGKLIRGREKKGNLVGNSRLGLGSFIPRVFYILLSIFW